MQIDFGQGLLCCQRQGRLLLSLSQKTVNLSSRNNNGEGKLKKDRGRLLNKWFFMRVTQELLQDVVIMLTFKFGFLRSWF